MLRIATLNIDKGGGPKERRDPLWDRVLELDRTFELDCIVFTEFKSKNGPWLCEQAKKAGFTCVRHTSQGIDGLGVLIAAKSPFEALENPADFNVDGERIMRATFDHFALDGIYLPQQAKKEPHLKYLVAEARQRPHDKIICIGDFNTGRCDLDVENSAENPRPIFESPSFRELERYWTDAWRYMHPDRREFSWYHPRSGRGFRIDHCFVSAPLVSRIQSATYNHLPRLEKRTDHSALIVEIDL